VDMLSEPIELISEVSGKCLAGDDRLAHNSVLLFAALRTREYFQNISLHMHSFRPISTLKSDSKNGIKTRLH